jgi:hypothetical protein
VTNLPEGTDRRAFRRILFDAPVSLRLGDREYRSRLIDISLKGVLLQIPEGWQPHEEQAAKLSVRLDDQEACIRMETVLIHQEQDRIGFQCRYIDMDSITHLRRLVELNLADPDLLERELKALG